MQKILIVEDDIDIQDILKNHLIDAGYEVAVASDGVAGIAMFGDTIDLVLLDIMLPKIDGYGVCEVIRRRSQVPIIMLTALSDEENQLRGFEQQIDDYIPKPFSPKILLCKIAAILRRRTAENQNQSLLTYKELSMDVDGFHVYQGGNEVVLTSKEFALLRLMLENQGKVFTRQMLLDRLWAADLEVEDRIVDSHIKNIRKKLNADYIKTIRGKGFDLEPSPKSSPDVKISGSGFSLSVSALSGVFSSSAGGSVLGGSVLVDSSSFSSRVNELSFS